MSDLSIDQLIYAQVAHAPSTVPLTPFTPQKISAPSTKTGADYRGWARIRAL